jgi:hypothetical protein
MGKKNKKKNKGAQVQSVPLSSAGQNEGNVAIPSPLSNDEMQLSIEDASEAFELSNVSAATTLDEVPQSAPEASADENSISSKQSSKSDDNDAQAIESDEPQEETLVVPTRLKQEQQAPAEEEAVTEVEPGEQTISKVSEGAGTVKAHPMGFENREDDSKVVNVVKVDGNVACQMPDEPQLKTEELPGRNDDQVEVEKLADIQAEEQVRLEQEKAEVVKRKAEQRKAYDLARLQAVKEASLKAEAEEAARIKAEDDARKAEADAFFKAEEARRKAAEEARLRTEAEKRVNEEKARQKKLVTTPRVLPKAPPLTSGSSTTHKTPRARAMDVVRTRWEVTNKYTSDRLVIVTHNVMVLAGNWTVQNRFFL